MEGQGGNAVEALNSKTWNLIASDPGLALELSIEAYLLAERDNNPDGMGEAVFNRAWALVYLGRDREAIHEFTHGLVFFSEPDSAMAGRIYNGMVTAFSNLGILDEALEALRKLYEVNAKTGNTAGALVALLNTGWMNIELGQYASAYQHLKDVESHVDAGEALSDPGNLYEALGICAVHLNRYEEAEDYFAAARQFEEVSQDELHQISAALSRSVMLEKTGHGADALTLAGSALANARRIGNQLQATKALLRLAEIRLVFGPIAEARSLIDSVLQHGETTVPPVERIRALELRATIAEQSNDLASAVRDLKTARFHESRLCQDRAAIKLDVLNSKLALEKERREHEAARSRNEDLESLNRHLAWMNRLGKIVNASLDWHGIALNLFAELRQYMPVDSLGIARCNPLKSGIDYYLFVESGRIVAQPEHGADFIDRQVTITNRERLSQHAGEGSLTVITTPLVLFDQVIGVLVVTRHFPHQLDASQVATMEAIAPIVAASFKNAESYSALTTAKNEISHIANHDALTGLYNRRFLFDFFDSWRSGVIRNGQVACLLYLDLDKFKPINDRFGHKSGDLVLQAIAKRFLEQFRESDVCARIGGDEFVVLSALPARDAVDRIHSKLQAALSEAIDLGGQLITTSASIGVAIDKDGQASLEDLLHRADLEMLANKKLGKG